MSEKRLHTPPTPKGTENITTPRLNLRKFKQYDASAVMAMNNDAETKRFFQIRNDMDLEAAESIIASYRVQYENDSYLLWCIALADGNKCIGKITATIDDKVSCAEISYMLVPDARHNGYMSEALKHVIAYLHDECNVHKIVAMIHAHNGASSRVVESAGMQMEGILTDALVDAKGYYYDAALYAHVQ